jgi:hypothetical protein
MALLTKTAIVGQVLLTAIMTLVAGMPHFSCVCPDGTIKAVCFTISSPSSCCCGTGKCCGATDGDGCSSRGKNKSSAADHGKRSCCGQHQNQKTSGPTSGSINSKATCCVRSLATPDSSAASSGKTLPSKDNSFETLSISGSSLSPVARQANFGGLWQTHQVAPPTDLFAIFCRLII